MKKSLARGFMLIETLIVTTFVSGVLIFLLVQFNNLSKNYEDSYKYNTVDGLYSLRNIRNYITGDVDAFDTIEDSISNNGYVDITDCNIFTEKEYCLKLFELENIDKVIVTENHIDSDLFFTYNDAFKKFINKVSGDGDYKYRILAEFNNNTYATIRFGD